MEMLRYMISDAAKRIDVEPHVLRYWEEELAVDIPRNEMGHRYYREEDIEMMTGVKYLKEKGFQLKSIRILLPEIGKVKKLEPRRLLELRDRLELAVSQEELRLQREEELKECGGEELPGGKGVDRPDGQSAAQERPEAAGSAKTAGAEAFRSAGGGAASATVRAEGEAKPGGTAERESSGTASRIKETAEAGKAAGDEAAGTASRTGEKAELVGRASSGDVLQQEDKMQRFRSIMNEIIMEAMQENNRQLTGSITESVSQEFEYQMKRKEQLAEEHFKQLDRVLREYQQGQKQAAVARECSGGRRQSKFFRKNGKVRI